MLRLILCILPFTAFAEQTLVLIKPDAVSSRHMGEIIAQYEKKGFRIAAIKMVHPTKEQAAKFYAVHKERPFYNTLTDYISSGPSVALVLEEPNAISRNRQVMGTTDPKQAKEGTLRARFGTDITHNAVHGSDSKESAEKEINFFFREDELLNRSARSSV